MGPSKPEAGKPGGPGRVYDASWGTQIGIPAGRDLRGLDLSGANLTGFNLEAADLRGGSSTLAWMRSSH